MSMFLAKESKKIHADVLPLNKLMGGTYGEADDDDDVDDDDDDDDEPADMKSRRRVGGAVRRGREVEDLEGDDDVDLEDEDLEGDDLEGDDADLDVDDDVDDEDNIEDPAEAVGFHIDEDEDEDDPEDDDGYLQKFAEGMKKNIIEEYHPEMKVHNDDEIDLLCRVMRDSDGNIACPLHQTLPILTKYEYAKVLGERALQLANGSAPMVEIKSEVIDPYLMAREELQQKAIPFIIKRPIGNRIEYWRLSDLEVLQQ